ncbi:MAG: mechanosensitive ion channel family protein [archaeon]|jgi:MscS family membrane protein|nr:hypothetical protein [Euryarchaeota archaeon]MDP6704397.1 mechanosensitive ion channel family protein [archaeon]MDP7260376.1 mechanosensitive ion channel family protein [archaeon]|tara:strand:+ start:8886 stop:9926 length:1041 start_codon:yes stop_codon:yes gene_type:complete
MVAASDLILAAGNEYIQSAFYAMLTVFAAIAMRYLTGTLLGTFLGKFGRGRVLVAKVGSILSFIILLFGLSASLSPLTVLAPYLLLINKIIHTIIVIIAIRVAMLLSDKAIDRWIKKWAEKSEDTTDDQIIALLHKLTKAIGIIIAGVIILDVWGADIGPLLASLGIAGLAIAFAMQSTLGNLFGGVSIIVDRSVRPGDVVEIDTTMGTVEDVGLRSTRIRTFTNELIVIPNGQVADAKIINHILPSKRVRLDIPLGVAYGSDVEKVKKTVLKSLEGIDNVLKEPKPMVRFTNMGDSALEFKVYIWINRFQNKFLVKDIANTTIYKALNKAKIAIPFPQMDVHLKK